MILIIIAIFLYMFGWMAYFYWKQYGDGKQNISTVLWVTGLIFFFLNLFYKVDINA
ncbi:hypothetical protein LCGC14_2737710 [marine sediment metagenome]|uniref:DUF4234 domain-containing protein n=1 Tax=marine sediment metagenome TaxID=412755 RepID=A0A0F9BED3_9ZZZZ